MKKALLKKSLLLGGILFGLILALVIVVSVFPLIPPFKNYYHSRTILTGSMEPKIPKGSVVINQWADQKNLKVGDIITYQHPVDKKITYVTHRIVKIDKTGLLWRFETRGDANPASDFGLVTQAGTEGKVIFTIPLIGYLIEFFKTPVGFILLVALPLLIFIVRQIRDVLRLWSKRVVPQEEDLPIAKKRKSSKTLAVMLVALAFLAARAGFVTYASFTSGQVTITGVTLSTAASFPGDVVINEVYYDVGVNCGDEGDSANPDEWIELYNNTDNNIDLKDWTITDNNRTTTIHSGSAHVPARGFALISKSAGTWTPAAGCWNPPSSAEIIVTGAKVGNGLENTGDRAVLKDNNSVEVDAVSWGDDPYAFGAGDGVKPLTGDGKSIARKTKGVDTDSPDDWGVLDNPNPGTNPHPPEENQPVLIEESSATSTPSPTPTTEPTPTPSPTPETSSTPTSTAEPSPTPVPSTIPAPTSEPTPTLTPTLSPTSEP